MYHLTVGIPTSWGCQQLGPYLHERGPCRSATNSPGGVTFSLGYNGRANFNWLGYLYANVGGCKPSWRCSSLLMLPMIGPGWTIPRAVQDTFCWYSMVCWLYWHASDKVEICEHWRRVPVIWRCDTFRDVVWEDSLKVLHTTTPHFRTWRFLPAMLLPHATAWARSEKRGASLRIQARCVGDDLESI